MKFSGTLLEMLQCVTVARNCEKFIIRELSPLNPANSLKIERPMYKLEN